MRKIKWVGLLLAFASLGLVAFALTPQSAAAQAVETVETEFTVEQTKMKLTGEVEVYREGPVCNVGWLMMSGTAAGKLVEVRGGQEFFPGQGACSIEPGGPGKPDKINAEIALEVQVGEGTVYYRPCDDGTVAMSGTINATWGVGFDGQDFCECPTGPMCPTEDISGTVAFAVSNAVAGPPGVGGMVEMLGTGDGPDSSVGSSSGSGFNYVALAAGLAAAAALAVGLLGGWYARRRWLF